MPWVTSEKAHGGWTMFTDATNTNGYLLSFKHHLPPGFSYEYSRRELIDALKHKSHSLDSFISKNRFVYYFVC